MNDGPEMAIRRRGPKLPEQIIFIHPASLNLLRADSIQSKSLLEPNEIEIWQATVSLQLN